jgi:regulator of sirC expression with transglutaminase-like and TPR domain
LNPNDAKAYYYRGFAYAEQGKYDRAIADLETYLKLRPDAENRAQVEQWIKELKGK